ALTQVECVFETVIRDRPVGRKRRLDFEGAVLVAHETVVNVHQDAEIVDRGDVLRVERLWFGDLADNQYVGWGLSGHGSSGGKCRSENQTAEGLPSLVHDFLLGTSDAPPQVPGHEATDVPANLSA